MRIKFARLMGMVVLLMLMAPGVTAPSVANPTVPTEGGVYTEDFSTYAAKEYTDNAEWDIWGRRLRLSRTNAIGWTFQVAVSPTDGSLFLIWVDARSGTDALYARRVDARGNRLWANDVRVDTGSGVRSSPLIALGVDQEGNAIVVWIDNSPDRRRVRAQKINPNGVRLWPSDMLVSSPTAQPADFPPAVAVSDEGVATIAWTDRIPSMPSSAVYAQALDAGGLPRWSGEVRVSAADTSVVAMNPVAASDAIGGSVIAWHDYSGGIYVQHLDANGQRLWTIETRANAETETGNAIVPHLARLGEAEFVVTWFENSDVYAQLIDSAGRRVWASDIRVNDEGGYSHSAEYYANYVATDAAENIFVGWTENGDFGAHVQRLDGAGNKLWPAAVRASPDSMLQQHMMCMAVLAGRDGHALVFWKSWDSADFYAQKLDSMGRKQWDPDLRLKSESGTATQQSPAIAADSQDNLYVVWGDGRRDHNDIYAQKFDVSGNSLWPSDVRVNSIDTASSGLKTAIAIEHEGGVYALWGESLGSTARLPIWVQRLDTDGNRAWAAAVQIGTSQSQDPGLTVDKNGYAVVVWSEYDYAHNILAQKLDKNGRALWEEGVQVSIDDGEAEEWPAVAADDAGGTLVVWVRSGTVYAQKLDADGRRVWPSARRVNQEDTGGIQAPVSISSGAPGSFFVAWLGVRDGFHCHAQRLNSNGDRMWATDAQLNVTSSGPSQTPCVVAAGSDDVAVVAWDGWDQSEAGGVFVQRIGSDGKMLWPVETRASQLAASERILRVPVTAVATSGYAYVAWQDERYANKDIFVQRIDPLGGRAWPTDIQVVYPDRFYVLTGRAQSKRVTTTADLIRMAALSANVQVYGGDVQFSLTNNGGADWFGVTPGVTHVFTTTGSDLRWRAELSADPLWSRTPIVNNLRIEYSSQAPSADDYEPDDTCADARATSVNGASQTRTFHQQGDTDWTAFDATTGTAYIIETRNVGARANTVIEPHATCSSPPISGGRAFGSGYTISFTAPANGRYYLKIINYDPAAFGNDTGYTLSVRAVQSAAVAVIVAGHDNALSAQDNITYAADRAYRIFRNAGIPKANIRYLAPQASHDADGDGTNDIAGPPTVANVRAAVQDWPRERGMALGVPFYLYLVDHGLVDRFKADGDAAVSQITAADLNLWLSNLEATSGADNINVIIDACYSGSFIDETTAGPATIAGRNRVVIASTTSDWQAFGPAGGQGLYFSNAFFSALENEQSLYASFLTGRQAVETQDLLQRPWLDDNGDRRFDTGDGPLAAGRALRRVALGGLSPRIEWVRGDSRSGVVRARVTDDSASLRVSVEVIAPSYVPPQPDGSGTTRIVDVPVVTLGDLDGDGEYTGTYSFAETGVYRLVAHAEDGEGNLALPVSGVAGLGSDDNRLYLPLLLCGH